MQESSIHTHKFRERHRAKELAGPESEWASASQVLSVHERIEKVVNGDIFLRHPPYPKQGGGVKNISFSYMRAGYDYRAREPSKEIAGACPILKVKPSTEARRINEAVKAEQGIDLHRGDRWTQDAKYGNPPSFTPLTLGETFRRSKPSQWLSRCNGSTAAARSVRSV